MGVKPSQWYHRARGKADPVDLAPVDVRFVPNGEWASCKACGGVDCIDFQVSDEMWARVVPEPWQELMVCLACFDAWAAHRGIDYREDLARYPLHFAGTRSGLELRVVLRQDEGPLSGDGG
jgi:hypothetical protein